VTIHLTTDDIQEHVWRFGLCAPNRAHVANVILNLARWADANSDGWAYWPKPARAAANAMHEIHAYTAIERVAQEQRDLTDQQVRKLLAPIKAFCTRQEAADRMTPAERNRILAG
jgi:hypothetical protein